MRHSDRRTGTAADAGRAVERRGPAEVVSLDEWRRRHRPQPRRRRRRVVVPAPRPCARAPRVPVEFWLIMLILVSAFAGALFALMCYGKIA